MSGNDRDQLKRLFDLARATPVHERDALLSRECADDPGLKDRVLSMINAAERRVATDETVRCDEAHDAADSWPSEHHRFEPGQRLGERYRFVALIGKGGMGEVYRADDLQLGQPVALKFLPERLATHPASMKQLRNEVRTARLVTHPNVCRMYDIGEVDGNVFLSMEYVNGDDLDSVLTRLGRPSREKSIQIALQLCDGLAAAHEQQVLHRDLKPANIMIDDRGQVRVADFGLAGFADDLERAEARVGTPTYMAPEQLESGSVSVQSDIYALGLVLYELFTGTCVFDTDDLETLKRLHQSRSIAAPSSLVADIDPTVERVIMHCLKHRPEDRPQSVDQVRTALADSFSRSADAAARTQESPVLKKVYECRDDASLTRRALLLVSISIVCFLLSGFFVLGGLGFVFSSHAAPYRWLALVWVGIGTIPLALGVAVLRVVRRLRVRGGHCSNCGYDLRGTDGRCPECGGVAET